MDNLIPPTDTSLEAKLNAQQRKLRLLVIIMLICFLTLLLAIAWLTLFKIVLNLIIAAIPVLTFYSFIFLILIKKYKQMAAEYRRLYDDYMFEKEYEHIVHSVKNTTFRMPF